MNRIFTLFVFTLFSVSVSSQSLCFDPANDNRYETLFNCNRIAVIDFDNDGHLDVMAVSGDAVISFHHGNGDGSFDAAIPLGEPGGREIQLGDLNNDGYDDIVRFSTTGLLTAQLYNSNGTLGAVSSTSVTITSGNYVSLDLGDVTGDGFLDAVVNDLANDALIVFMGDGAGGFTALPALDTNDQPANIAVGDLNNDGKDDIVCSYAEIAEVKVFIATGSGAFVASNVAVPNAAGPEIGSVVIDNIDGDAFNDILVGGLTDMHILKNTDGDSFTLLTSAFMGSYAYSFVTGDWDDDGDIDPAWANSSGGGVTINLNNGDGSFPLYGNVFFSANGFTEDLASGDFDEDGNMDIVTANGYPGNFTFLQGHGDGTFGFLTLITGYGATGMCVADFDQDTDLDVIGLNRYFSQLTLSRNNGDGSFTDSEWNNLAPYSCEAAASGDFNSDNIPDVVAHGSSGMLLCLNNGNGTFATPVTYTGTTTAGGGDRAIAVGYFNDDDILDVAGTYVSSDELTILFGLGNGTLSAPLNLIAGDYPRAMTAGDLNADTFDDIVVCSDLSADVRVFFSNGDGTFQNAQVFTLLSGPQGATIFDVNEDNKMDVVVSVPNMNQLFIYLGNNGTFDAPYTVDAPTSSNMSALSHADIDNDGHQDILACLYQFDNVGAFFGNGDGTFDSAVQFETDRNPTLIIPADFNQDGATDMAVLNSTTNNMSVILNNSAFISADGDLAFCEGDSVVLTASEGYSYEWMNLSGANTQSVTIYNPGEYYCAITNQAGTCTLLSSSVIVEVFQSQEVSLTLDSTMVCEQDPAFYLSGGYPFGGVYTGPGVTANMFYPSEAGGLGAFTITYTYEDAGGCTNSSVTDEITVVFCDNVNEFLNVKTTVYPSSTSSFVNISGTSLENLKVYDASGRMIENRQLNQSVYRADCTSFESGMYFMEITDAGVKSVHRIMKVNDQVHNQ